MLAPPKPPSHDELEALIKEARERQLRRRFLVVAAVAVAAGVSLGAYALTVGGKVDKLGKRRAQSGNAVGPQCRASQLSAGFGFQGSTETMLGGATLRNTSGSTCSLPKAPPRFRIVWHGKSLAIPVRPGSATAPPWPRARVLAPGKRVFIVMQWFGLPVIGGGLPPLRLRRLCSHTTGANFKPQVELRFPDGLRLVGRATGLMLPACGPLHSSWMQVSRPLILH